MSKYKVPPSTGIIAAAAGMPVSINMLKCGIQSSEFSPRRPGAGSFRLRELRLSPNRVVAVRRYSPEHRLKDFSYILVDIDSDEVAILFQGHLSGSGLGGSGPLRSFAWTVKR